MHVGGAHILRTGLAVPPIENLPGEAPARVRNLRFERYDLVWLHDVRGRLDLCSQWADWAELLSGQEFHCLLVRVHRTYNKRG